MSKCKECKKWIRTSNLVNDPNPSGKCNGRYNGKYEGYGTHANTGACYDFEGEGTKPKNWIMKLLSKGGR